MRTCAVRFHRLGGPEVLALEEVDIGAPAVGEVCLRIEAFGLNRAEAAFRAGQYIEAPRLPSLLGYEAAGLVEAVGTDVDGIAVGDAVCVLPSFSMTRYGVQAQHAIVPASALIPRPSSLSATEAAALWMATLTAYGALVDIGRIGEGDAVVVTAASSSVGIAAIQIARQLGAVPLAVTRSRTKVDALLELGASAVIVVEDDTDLASEIALRTGGLGARLAFDPIAGPGTLPLAEALAPGGTLVIYGNLSTAGERTPFPFYAAVGKGLSVRGYLVFELLRDAARLREARAFIEAGLASGAIRPVIDRVFGFEDVVAAYGHLESNAQVGKVVVEVSQD